MDLVKEQFLNHQLRTALALNEGWDTKVGKVGEENIYTNDEIKQSFINSIKSQDTFKPIMPTVIRLIETDRVIPAFVKVGLIQRIIRHYKKQNKQFAESKFTMASYDIDIRKIIVLVENLKDDLYWKKQEALSLVLLHEFQHMTSALFPISFITLHSKAFSAYYKRFFDLFFNVKISDTEAVKLAQWLHYKSETVKGRKETGNFGSEYLKVMWTILSPHYPNKKELEKRLVNYFKAISIYFSSFEMFVELTARKDPSTFFLYNSLRESYKALNILKTDTLVIQEAIFPSEIICIESEYNTQPRHFKLITKIE